MRPIVEPQHLAIRASAGSGKTTSLAQRYVDLLAAGVPPARIAAMTFSRKAGREIFDKIMGVLCDLAGRDESRRQRPEVLSYLARHPGIPPARWRACLRAMADELHRLQIGTLDSFAVRMAHLFPMELGVPAVLAPAEQDSAEAGDMRREAIARVLDESAAADLATLRALIEDLTGGTARKGYSEALDRNVEISLDLFRRVSDPKAWGDASRIWPEPPAWLRGAGAPIDALCDEAERGIRTLPAGAGSQDIAFVHLLLGIVETVRTHRQHVRWAAALAAGKSIWTQAAGRILAAVGADLDPVLTYYRKERRLPAGTFAAFRRCVEFAVAQEILGRLRETRATHDLLRRYSRHHEALAAERGLCTFGDVQYLVAGAGGDSPWGLTRSPERADRLAIDFRLDAELDHWLLDEFQDTSVLQWRMLANLVDEVVQDDSGRRTFFFVGDPKQAIYQWRGGEPGLFGAILRKYAGAVALARHQTCYRSAPAVLSAVNAVFENVTACLQGDPAAAEAARDWHDIWARHEGRPEPEIGPGWACAVETPRPPRRGSAVSDEEEIDEGIHPQLATMARIVRRERVGADGPGCAILVRTNRQVETVVGYLRGVLDGVDVAQEGVAEILNSADVRLLMALLRYAAHPGDRMARQHLAMSPLTGPEPDAWFRRDEHRPERLLRDLHALGLTAFLRRWIDRLERAAPPDAFGRQRCADLIEAAEAFERNAWPDADAFLRHLEAHTIKERNEEAAVRVMTVHQSKGLEFDMVILPFLDVCRLRDAKPDFYAGDAPAPWVLVAPPKDLVRIEPRLAEALRAREKNDIRESLCTLYVGMTRARQALYLLVDGDAEADARESAEDLPADGGKRKKKRKDDPPEVVSLADIVRSRFEASAGTIDIEGTSYRVRFQEGSPDWYARWRKISPVTAPSAAPSAAAGRRPAWQVPSAPPLTERRPRRQPSAEAEETVSMADLFSAAREGGLGVGLAVHDLFRRVEWAEELTPRRLDALVADWRRDAGPEAPALDRAERLVRQAFATAAIRRVFERPAPTAEVWRERAFEAVIDGAWTSGAFDRVTILRDAAGKIANARIADFKSDACTPAGAADLALRYRPQMALYRQALARILRIEERRIAVDLVLLQAGVTVAVPFGDGSD